MSEMVTKRFEAQPEVPLEGELDLHDFAERAPREHTIKGMFFRRCADALSSSQRARVFETLEQPPRRGEFGIFESYPARDYRRLFVAAAQAAHPLVSPREAVRLYARDEIRAFADTMLGRVTLGLMSDPAAALLRYPEVFQILASGPTASARKLSEHAVFVELRGANAEPEYALGVMEGIVLAFKRRPRTVVETENGTIRLEVRWTL